MFNTLSYFAFYLKRIKNLKISISFFKCQKTKQDISNSYYQKLYFVVKKQLPFVYRFQKSVFRCKKYECPFECSFQNFVLRFKKRMTVWVHAFLAILTGKTVFYSIQYNNLFK